MAEDCYSIAGLGLKYYNAGYVNRNDARGIRKNNNKRNTPSIQYCLWDILELPLSEGRGIKNSLPRKLKNCSFTLIIMQIKLFLQ